MKDIKDSIIAAVAFLLFFAMMFFTVVYQATMTQQCKEAAIGKGFDAIQVQAVCGK